MYCDERRESLIHERTVADVAFIPKVIARSAEGSWLRPLSLLVLIWAALTAGNH